MTNENLPTQTNKIFNLSRHRVVFYTLGVFLLSLLVAFWADNLMVGGIWDMTAAEIAAVFAIALGVSAIFFVFFKLTEKKPVVAVTEDGLLFRYGKGMRRVRFSEITSVREHEGALSRIVKTHKILLETRSGSFVVYLSASDAREFLDALPVVEEPSPVRIRIVSGKGKYVCFAAYIARIAVLFLLASAATLPAVFHLLGKDGAYFLYGLAALFGVLLIAGIGRCVYLLIRYAGHTVKIEADKFNISYGKLSRTSQSLYFSSILAVNVRQSFIEKLFGVCRVRAESRQKAKGVSDVNYFPFLMPRACAEAIVGSVFPDRQFTGKGRYGGMRGILPYTEYLLWYVAAVVILAVFLTPFMLFLLLIPAAALLCLFLRGRYALGDTLAVFVYGVTAENTLFVRYADIQGAVAGRNFISSRLKNCSLDICVGEYAKVFSVGFVDETVFCELTEKMEKKVDKAH